MIAFVLGASIVGGGLLIGVIGEAVAQALLVFALINIPLQLAIDKCCPGFVGKNAPWQAALFFIVGCTEAGLFVWGFVSGITSLLYLILVMTISSVPAGVATAALLQARGEEAAEEEASELKFHAIMDAACTDATDMARILRAVTGKEYEVENALRVLVREGISTPEMRRASLSWSTGNIGYVEADAVFKMLFYWAFVLLLNVHAGRKRACEPTNVTIALTSVIGMLSSAAFAYGSSARELGALVIHTCGKGGIALICWSMVQFLFLMLFWGWDGGDVAELTIPMSTCNATAAVAILTCLRHRHIRREALQSFCNVLAGISLLQWTVTVGVMTKSVGLTLTTLSCLILLGIVSKSFPSVFQIRAALAATSFVFYSIAAAAYQCIVFPPDDVIVIVSSKSQLKTMIICVIVFQVLFVCAMGSYTLFVEIRHCRHAHASSWALVTPSQGIDLPIMHTVPTEQIL
jgi:hypothetical protein